MKELTLRELQLKGLEILKEAHRYCEANGLRYSMAYGSLIGVVRHKGFIPWDDDVDIVMPRPDFERFIRGFSAPGLAVAVPGGDSYQPIARVYDTRDTAAYSKYPYKKGRRPGVWIDVYPIDNVSDDPAEFDRHAARCRAMYRRMVRLRKQLARPADLARVPPRWHYPWRQLRLWWWRLKNIRVDLMEENRRFIAEMTAYPWGSTGHVSQLGIRDWDYRDHLPADLFDNTVLMPFEDTEVRVPADYHTFLIPQYPTYMEMPPEGKRQQHTLSATRFFWKDKK